MKMLFILLSIELLCLPLFGKDIDYKAEKLPLDTTVYYHILKLEETITLEENDSIILSSISDIKLNYDNSEILICDRALRSVLNFDYTNGNYIERKVSGLYIQHDLAVNYDKAVKTWLDEPYELVDTTRYREIGLTKEDVDRLLVSSFNYIIDDNKDNLELLTYITLPASTFTQKMNQIFNLPINVVLDKNSGSIITFSFFNFDSDKYFPLSNNGVKVNNDYYITGMNAQFIFDYSQEKIKNKDDIIKYELTTLTRHDSTGNLKSIVGKIPKSYLNSNLLYEYLILKMINISDEIYYGYHFDENIYKENDKVAFTFKNLPYSNSNGLADLKNISSNRRKNKNLSPLNSNEIGQICPISLVNIINRKDNLLVLFTVYEENHPLKMYYILQEYTTEGELLTQTYFDDHPENQIKNVFYDSKNDYLCFLRKSKKGWTVEKRSFK